MIATILSQTGGLIYHLRALRYRRSLWAPFRNEIGYWLMQWRPPEKSILLIGPSGGYCLPPRFLDRFEQVSAIDPDPVAQRIFKTRMRRSVQWSYQDYFTPEEGRFDSLKVKTLLEKYPNHAILFCNFLGQLPFLDTTASQGETYSSWKKELSFLLQNRSWASFHDRLSGSLMPNFPNRSWVTYPRAVSDHRLLEDLYAPPAGSPDIELSDHLTGDLFPDHTRRFFRWQIQPGVWHLIEAVQHEKTPS